jgi:hypothetical protein
MTSAVQPYKVLSTKYCIKFFYLGKGMHMLTRSVVILLHVVHVLIPIHPIHLTARKKWIRTTSYICPIDFAVKNEPDIEMAIVDEIQNFKEYGVSQLTRSTDL